MKQFLEILLNPYEIFFINLIIPEKDISGNNFF
jgi:hypothetical protein